VALHRVVELNTGRIVAHKFGATAKRTASYVAKLDALLKAQGINLRHIPHYRAVNELRLLNNAIKHDGPVSTELASEYPRWKKDAPLADLEAAYNRLKAHVPPYIFRFAERLKLRLK